KLTAQIARSGFLELAEGDWLTLVARHVYGVEREQATFAAGEVTLTNSGGGSFTLDADDLVVWNPTIKKSFRNPAGFTLGPADDITIPIVAIEAGTASTSSPGAITEIETTLLGVTCKYPVHRAVERREVARLIL
ncbi:MAG TPA: baseplate J/gp47 family protein, partial [Polyangiales bacterium]|nr:baseplate J/gp47 family protein [Polyangiales bacterium]